MKNKLFLTQMIPVFRSSKATDPFKVWWNIHLLDQLNEILENVDQGRSLAKNQHEISQLKSPNLSGCKKNISQNSQQKLLKIETKKWKTIKTIYQHFDMNQPCLQYCESELLEEIAQET